MPEMSWGKANIGACPNPVRPLMRRHHCHMQTPCTHPSPIYSIISHLKTLRACLSGQCLPSTAHGRDFCFPSPRTEMTLHPGRLHEGGCALVYNTLGLCPVLDTVYKTTFLPLGQSLQMTDALEKSQLASGKQMKWWDSPGNDQLPVLSLSSDEEDEDAKKEREGEKGKSSPLSISETCMSSAHGA